MPVVLLLFFSKERRQINTRRDREKEEREAEEEGKKDQEKGAQKEKEKGAVFPFFHCLWLSSIVCTYTAKKRMGRNKKQKKNKKKKTRSQKAGFTKLLSWTKPPSLSIIRVMKFDILVRSPSPEWRRGRSRLQLAELI